ncbi:MAG: ATP synthase F0 subunit A [Deltaproteobacteria bacterium]|nr:MAG: ATP synthase F0 subunit A [Deltaproteobacteria bacterium]
MKQSLRRAFAALLVTVLVTAPVLSALAAEPGHHGAEATMHAEEGPGEAAHGEAAHHAAAHHDTSSRLADEDHHWWLGKNVLPASFRQQVAELLVFSKESGTLMGDPAERVDVGHVFMAILVFLMGLGMALAARRKVVGKVLPPKTFGAAAVFDIIMDALMGVMESMMPRERALKYLPLMTAVAVFILLSNLLGLIPGLLPPTSNLNTTLALGGMAFIVYNVAGIRAHGPVNYIKHFMGPIWWLAPLMLPIELVSHIVRPISLAIRLAGNMFGDHQVVFVFVGFTIPLLPLPIMALGLLVCIIQTVVFTMLFIVYVALATDVHDEHHDHDHDHGHAAAPGAEPAPAH